MIRPLPFSRLLGRALLLLCVLPTALGAQASDEFHPPDDLKPFWDRFQAARFEQDERAMDEAVRRYKTESEGTLYLLLDEVSRRDRIPLHDDARFLAWSLDRVERTERFIERVRLVLNLEMSQRGQRRVALREYHRVSELWEEANKTRNAMGWNETYGSFDKLLPRFEELGDHEQVINILSHMADIEARRSRLWEQAVLLKRLVAVGDQLGYRDTYVDEQRLTLQGLILTGYDPDKEKPADAPGGSDPTAASDTGLGRSLTSWAADSRSETFPLAVSDPRKGPENYVLPSFYPFEQQQLWPMTWVADNGPADFDQMRAIPMQIRGQRWILGRTGIGRFTIDSDGDGKADVTFSPSSTPSRIEVPLPGEGPPYPLWVAIFSDREKMFSIDTNYAPTPDFARLRFYGGRYLEGRVLGETWKVFDANLDGQYGPWTMNYDDLVTVYRDDNHVYWVETDAVHIGRAKRAVPLSSVLHVNGKWYRTEIDPQGATVTTRELALETGFVKLDLDLKTMPAHLVVQEVGGQLEGAFFDILPERRGGLVELPAGTYQIVSGRVTTGRKMSLDQVRIYQGRSQPFDVERGRTTNLALGAPFSLDFATSRDGDQHVLDTLTLRVFGRGGEEYAMFFDDALQPEVEVRDANGTRIEKGKLRLSGTEQWQQAGADTERILWFPMRYSVSNPRNPPVEFKLVQKAHALLGGPFESDWIR